MLFSIRGRSERVASRLTRFADICGDLSQAERTWVLLTEAAEGGWGIAGTAYDREEFAVWRPPPQRSEGVATTCRECSPNGVPGSTSTIR